MRTLLSWTGSRLQLHMFRAGMLLPGIHLHVLRDTQFAKPRVHPRFAALMARRASHG